MAHQYPAMPPFGNGYPQMPYYPPFPPSASQPLPAPMQSYQQLNALHSNPQTPTPQNGSMRYDVNAQIQQGTPFPIPQAFNPELLKHYPLPPPPPHPSVAFGSVPSPSSVFPQFGQPMNGTAQHHMQQQYPALLYAGVTDSGRASAQPALQKDGSSYYPLSTIENHVVSNNFSRSDSAQQEDKVEDMSAAILTRQEPQIASTSQSLTERRGASQLTTPVSVKMMKDAPEFSDRAREPQTLHHQSAKMASDVQSAMLTQSSRSFQPSTELHAQAKAAILALTSHNITHRDLLAEGISEATLRDLYLELGLGWQSEPKTIASEVQSGDELSSHSVNSPAQAVEAIPPTSTVQEALPSVPTKRSPSSHVLSGVSPAINPGMERKDRIAQLLAARAGKAIASPPASPIPPTDAAFKQNAMHTPESSKIESAVTKLVPTNQISKATTHIEHPRHDLQDPRTVVVGNKSIASVHKDTSLSGVDIVPAMQASYTRAGLSSMIPGLFIDEEANSDDVAEPTKGLTDAAMPTAPLSEDKPLPSGALKRTFAETLPSESSSRAAKRVSPQFGETNDKLDDGSESGEASEGEIVEDIPNPASVLVNKTAPTSLPSQGIHRNSHSNYEPNTSKSRAPSEMKHVESGATKRNMPESEQRSTINPSSGATAFLGPASPSVTIAVNASQPSVPSPTAGVQDVVPSPRMLSKLTPAQLAQRAAQLKADLIRQKAIRQKQLTQGVTTVDDEVAKTQQQIHLSKSRLSEVRSLLIKCENELSRARQDEHQIVEEIERLEKKLESSVLDMTRGSDVTTQQKPPTSVGPSSKPANEQLSEPSPPSPPSPLDAVKGPLTPPALPSNGATQTVIPQADIADAMQLDSTNTQQIIDPLVTASSIPPLTGSQPRLEPATESLPIQQQLPEAQLHYTTLQGELQGMAPEVVNKLYSASLPRNEAEVCQESDGMGDDGIDTRSEDSRMSIDNDDESSDEVDIESDGSASMSDSGSEDYEPAEPEPGYVVEERVEASEEYRPENLVDDELTKGEDEDDDYEPSDVLTTSAIPSGKPSAPTSAPASPPASSLLQTGIDGFANGSAPAISQTDLASRVDDQESGLQLSEAVTLTKPQTGIDLAQKGENITGEDVLGAERASAVRFVPYQSPLSAFKSYRFHPSFNEHVKSGYRSLTYSNNIDDKMPICPTELGGEICLDRNCQEQHFGSMALTDDKILVQMSSANDIKDKALRDKYLLGLKQVIASLRQDGVKEFSQVADALSKYRREWSTANFGV